MKVKRKIDIIVYKRESFDSDRFKEDIASLTDNFIFLLFDTEGISCTYSPAGVRIINNKIKFLRFKNRNLYYCLYPLAFLVDNFRIFKLFLILCSRFRVKAIFMETYSAAFTGILRKCNLTERLIYVTTDWFTGNKSTGFWGGFGGSLIFPLVDYTACKLSDITLNVAETQASARHKLWGRGIARKEMLFLHHLENKNKTVRPNTKKTKIVFIGDLRKDSGLDLVIKSLTAIRKKADFSVKIIGPVNTLHKDLKGLAREYNVEEFIEFLGFVERTDYEKVLSDCLFGVNLITQKDTFTQKSMPSKVLDYFQYLLPVIATKNIGELADIIIDNNLGFIIEPMEEEFIKASVEIYDGQGQFRENIIKFINNRPYTKLEDLIVN